MLDMDIASSGSGSEAISMERSSTLTLRGSSGSTRSTSMESAVRLNTLDLSMDGLLPSLILDAGRSIEMDIDVM